MILLFAISFYLGVGMQEHKGQVYPNDYSISIATQLKENRIIYGMERNMWRCPCGCNYVVNEQNYTFISNMVFVKDKMFAGLQNNCDISALGLYREDIDIGIKLKSSKVNHYLTTGISMEKYKKYQPCFRYGLIYQDDPKLEIPTFKDNLDFWKTAMNLVISGINGVLSVGYKWHYETRANFLFAGDRYEYSLETATRLYILKNFGWEANAGYGKYNNIENHFAGWRTFLDF